MRIVWHAVQGNRRLTPPTVRSVGGAVRARCFEREPGSVVSVHVSDDSTNDAGAVVSNPPAVKMVRLDTGLPLPRRAHPGDAGVDLHITVDATLRPGERLVVGTGIALALPLGTVGLVHPRSGLAARSGLSIVNAPGTVDAGYRGEIKVCLINLDPDEPIELVRGDRVAQLLVQKVELVEFVEVPSLDDTSRGSGGHGSSGGHASLASPAAIHTR